MTEALTTLDSPIDVMYPIHRALRAEAAHAERLVRALHPGESLHTFAQAFAHWFRALEYHAVTEDAYMTPDMDRPAARTNEVEHQQLTALLIDIQTFLQQVHAPAGVSARTLRHMLGKVVALGIAQDDHLEEEEARILPVIRQQMGQHTQWDIARHLLCDTQEPGWIMAWLAPCLTPREHQLLIELTHRAVPA